MKSGIYYVQNITSGKTYVGSSVNVATRLRQHELLLHQGKHYIVEMQEDFDNGDEFIFFIIERCAVDLLNSIEQKHIDLKIGCLYNRSKTVSDTDRGNHGEYPLQIRLNPEEKELLNKGSQNRGLQKATYLKFLVKEDCKRENII